MELLHMAILFLIVYLQYEVKKSMIGMKIPSHHKFLKLSKSQLWNEEPI